jgi:hypothetical protein
MKNRDIIMRRLEKIEGCIEKLNFALRRGQSWEIVNEHITEMRDSINDAKMFVQQEPLSPNEINTSL